MAKFNLTIDGVIVEAQTGMTVLQAARNAGLFIPSLCAHEELEPYGACRLCVVEIEKMRGTPTACTTPAAEGMIVRTNTEQLQKQRQRTLELLMSAHPSPCFSCDSRLDCESVKKTPTKAGASTRCGACSNRPVCGLRGIAMGSFTREMNLPVSYDISKIDKRDPFIDRDYNLCVLCGICVRTCAKMHNGKPAISISSRGKFARVTSAFNNPWSSEECMFCGACVDECPTGSLTDRWSKWYGAAESECIGNCEFCGKKCELKLKIKDGRLIGTSAKALKPENALCVNGKFVYPQVVNAKHRLGLSSVLRGRDLVPAEEAELVEYIAEILKNSQNKLLVLASSIVGDNVKSLLKGLAEFKNGHVEFIESGSKELPCELAERIKNGEFKDVFSVGDYISEELADSFENIFVADFLATKIQKKAKAVIAARVLDERNGKIKPFGKSLNFEVVLSCICSALGVKGAVIEKKAPPAHSKPYSHSILPRYFFGHSLVELVPDLELLGFEKAPEKEENVDKFNACLVLENITLAPNFHALKIKAPEIAKYAKAGQFAVLLANKHSERSPFTIIDWNAQEGWIRFIIEEVGRSSAELGAKKAGDYIAHVSGPLGTPIDLSEVKSTDSVLLSGGCYGIGAVYPIARELKKIGAKVTVSIEASSSYLLYFEDELKSVCDELIVSTRDGTKGLKGGCADVMKSRKDQFDMFVSIGCVFMMKQASKVAAEIQKKTLCALNPIMVDGTGMCGACRVSVGGDVKFACVDGPFFDLKGVDFDELAKRRSAYTLLEVDAMPRHHNGKCHQ